MHRHIRGHADMIDALVDSPFLLLLIGVGCVAVSSLVPASPGEPIVAGIAAVLPPWLLLPLVALVTVTSIGTKTLVFRGGARVRQAVPERYRARVEALGARLSRRGPKARRATILLSALTGLPPFYVVTLLCGTLRLPLREWLVAGAVGCAIRTTGLVLLPRFLAWAF
jgi:membrane protein YqaA with SNARE-associated domain